MMKTLSFLLLLISAATAQPSDPRFNPDSVDAKPLVSWMLQNGDDAAWSNPAYDDSRWKKIDRYDLPLEEKGVYWLRTRVAMTRSLRESPLFLKVGLLQSAYDIYWNGALIASNGTVGNSKESETPGILVFAVNIGSLARQNVDNVLSIRCSNFHASTPGGSQFVATLHSDVRPSSLTTAYLFRLVLHLGIGFAGVVFGLALYLAGGKFKNYLYYSFLCLALVTTKGLEYVLLDANPSMSVMKVFDPVWVGGFYLSDLSIVLFFLFSFDIPHKMMNVFSVSVVLLVFYVVNLHSVYFEYLNYDVLRVVIIPYVVSLIIYSTMKKKAGSVIALVGYSLYALPVLLYVLGASIPPISFDIARYVIMLALIMVSSRQVLEQQELQRLIELRAQRLETELLKKTIQPHFIVNSLSSVKSLARREPGKANRLVQALASEFRILIEISSQKEIPIAQEIQLCDYHLEVMGYRWDAKYNFIKQHVPEEQKIPPLILHTLIENGLTHAFKPKENGTFWLKCEKDNGTVQYCLQNNGSLLESLAGKPNIEEGMGLKYVKARLEESYPGNWSLTYGVNDGRWEVILKIIRERAR